MNVFPQRRNTGPVYLPHFIGAQVFSAWRTTVDRIDGYTIIPSIEEVTIEGRFDTIRIDRMGKDRLGPDILGWDAIHDTVHYILCVKSQLNYTGNLIQSDIDKTGGKKVMTGRVGWDRIGWDGM